MNYNNKSVIYFAPVPKKYFEEWDYYQVDLEMLKQCFSSVIICHGVWSFLKTVFSIKTNAVYCWWWHQSVICVVISRLLKIPVYVTGAVHMYDESGAPDFYSKSFLFRLACRISWRLASKNLFISKSQFRQICSHEKVNNSFILKSSLNKYFEPSMVIDKKSNKLKFCFLTIVWMTKDQIKRKSIYETLEAVSMLVKNGYNNFEWIIAGGSADGVSDLEKKIHELKLSKHVKLYINITNEQKKLLLENADLYIQPSYYEGFGNAVLEAMSFGVPAVVSRNTAQAEVIGRAGFIVEEIDQESIMNNLKKYMELSDYDRKKLYQKVIETVKSRHLFEYRVKQFLSIINIR